MNNKATKKEFIDAKVSFGDIQYIYPYNIWRDAIHSTHDEMFQINMEKLGRCVCQKNYCIKHPMVCIWNWSKLWK